MLSLGQSKIFDGFYKNRFLAIFKKITEFKVQFTELKFITYCTYTVQRLYSSK